MKNLISIMTAIAIAMLSFTALAKEATGKRQFESAATVNAIEIGGVWEVVFTQSPGKTKITVETPKRYIDCVDISISKGCLYIKTTQRKNGVSLKNGISLNNGEKMAVVISSPEISKFNIEGCCHFKVSGPLNINRNFDLRTSGSSEFDCANISCIDAKISTSGASEVECGNIDCNTLDIVATGSSEIKGRSIKATQIISQNSGSSEAEFSSFNGTTVKTQTQGSSEFSLSNIKANNVSAQSSGASEITLSGIANQVSFSASGSSEIKAKSLSADKGSAMASGASDIKCRILNMERCSSSGSSDIHNSK